MAEERMEEGIQEKPDAQDRDHGSAHKNRTSIAIIILLIVLVPTIVFAAYPRVDMEVKLWYSEGMMGSISVDLEIRNTGTVSISLSEVKVTILNETGEELKMRAYTNIRLDRRAAYGAENIFLSSADLVNETHWSTYTILLDMTFTAKGERYTLEKEYQTVEPDMSIVFKESITYW